MKFKVLLLPLYVFLSLLLAGCPAPCNVEAEEIESIRNDVAQFVKDLENYKNERNDYPKSLTELYPPHVTVSERAGGRKLTYQRISENQYNLRVHSRNGGSYSGSCSAAEIEVKWKELNDKR